MPFVPVEHIQPLNLGSYPSAAIGSASESTRNTKTIEIWGPGKGAPSAISRGGLSWRFTGGPWAVRRSAHKACLPAKPAKLADAGLCFAVSVGGLAAWPAFSEVAAWGRTRASQPASQARRAEGGVIHACAGFPLRLGEKSRAFSWTFSGFARRPRLTRHAGRIYLANQPNCVSQR